MLRAVKHCSLTAFALLSWLGTAQATLYPAETKNLRPDSARSLCMDLSGDAKLAKCNGSNAQKITLERRENGERRMRVGSQCLEGNREGEALFLAPCRNVVTQTWTYNNTGRIKNGNGLCVDVEQNRKTAGTPVITYRCNGTINQRWARYDLPKPETPAGAGGSAILRPAHARDKCLDATAQGELILWTCHHGRNQQFVFRDNQKTMIRVNAGCLTAIRQDGPVYIKSCAGGARQMWTVEKSGRIVNASGACLDVRMAANANGTPVLSYKCTGQPNQRFLVIR
ncbi:hypothetical protein HNR59_003359 [Aquamicrobium lusatiense]|uniref:Ricin B lectin domain-containing protein n=1 Tax=Aquamicrobium lusatiense TaxID=89772 RepID=A0A7W9VX24_9HYPH|nr:ricin-type beta-trefoil lectin domain protein [Aquamicrobium lusatiense]MBB6013965.1 hypothetical protein [Aquamicrobium lusatiense]